MKPVNIKRALALQNEETVVTYNHNNLQGSPSYVAVANGILSEIANDMVNNPVTAERMDTALCISYGRCYQIAKKFECRGSFTYYACQLKLTVAHPVTNFDTEVIILTKESRNLQDCIITANEVDKLYKEQMTASESVKYNKQKLAGAVPLLFRAFCGTPMKSHRIVFEPNHKMVKSHDTLRVTMLPALLKIAPKSKIYEVIDGMIANRNNDLKRTLNESQSCQTTAQWHEGIRLKIKSLKLFKEWIESDGFVCKNGMALLK